MRRGIASALGLGFLSTCGGDADGRAWPRVESPVPARREVEARAEELIAINAVRGARSCVQLDRKNVGNGRPGLWSRRISRLLGDELPGVSRTRAS